MFQNISEEIKQEEYDDVNVKNKDKLKNVLKNMFKLQNILVYVISFFISTVKLGIDVTPFGIAMFAVACGSAVPAGIVLVLAGLGTLVGLGFSSFVEYLITAILFLIFTMIFKPKMADEYRNETNKVGIHLFIATLIVQAGKYFIGDFLLYDLFICVIGSILTYVFYKIFVNAIIVIKEFKLKTAFTIEEVIGASVLLAITVNAFNGINIMGFSISNILTILLVLILGWKNGILVGATSGISVGVTLGMINATSPMQIAIYGISGMFAGILNKFGKIGVVVGFVFGNILITYIVNGNTNILINIREIFIAALGLLLIPKKVEINIQDLMGRNKLLTAVGEKRLTGSKDMTTDLNNVSNTIDEMIKSYEEAAVTLADEKQEEKIEIEKRKNQFIEDFLGNLDSYKENVFYEELVENEEELVSEIYQKCIEKDVIVEKDIIEIFENHNNFIVDADEKIKEDLLQIAKIANRVYKLNEMNNFWKHKESNNKKAISNQLKGVSKAISNLKEKLSNNDEFNDKSKEIQILLNQRNVNCTYVSIKQNTNKKYIIKLGLDINDNTLRESDKIKSIENLLTKVFKNSITFQRDYKNLEKQEYEQVYSSEDKFILQVGTSKITKNDSKVSGDSNMQIRLEDGKYMLLISDGMGSGEEAKQSSKLVIKMMKNLLSSGFDRKESINLINSTISLSSKEEMYATVDMAILDLYEGNAEFIKNGACATYIKNKKNVNKIELNNLPVGIVEDSEMTTYERNLHDGDIIIMCSDGILESKEEIGDKDWLEGFVKGINTNNVQKIADLILAEAIDNGYGIAKDDMTVIVSKIVSKK